MDTADAQGMTPLLYACKNGQMRLAKYLLKERRPSAKARSAQGWTGLHFLALSALGGAQQGTRGPNATNNREKKAKDRMSSQDRLEVAELLLANGCDVNAKAAGVSAFYAACMEGDRELVRLCIDHGAQVNAVGEADDRPRAEEMQEGGDGDVGLDDMNVEEWTDDDEGGAWDDQLNSSNNSAMDEEQQEQLQQPQRTSPASESRFKGREDVAVRSASAGGKRSRSKSYRERVNIFQRDREEEAIGESGTYHLHPAVRVVSLCVSCRTVSLAVSSRVFVFGALSFSQTDGRPQERKR